jgi:hypothetical protein
MSYVPATSDRDMWAILGGLIAVVLGFAWHVHVKERREMAVNAAPPVAGEPGTAADHESMEAGQEPEAPR